VLHVTARTKLTEMERRTVWEQWIAESDWQLPLRCDACGKVVVAADVVRNLSVQ
jgi:hypothetical protein